MSIDTTVFDKSNPYPKSDWQLLYQIICCPQKAMVFLAHNSAPNVTGGLFIASVLAISALMGANLGVMGYLGAILMFGASQLFNWIFFVAQVHFWANVLGCQGKIMGLFRASSSALVPLICVLPITLLIQSDVSIAYLFLIFCCLWACWRISIAVAVIYEVDIVKAIIILMAPMVSFMFLGGLFMAGEFTLLLQILKG